MYTQYRERVCEVIYKFVGDKEGFILDAKLIKTGKEKTEVL